MNEFQVQLFLKRIYQRHFIQLPLNPTLSFIFSAKQTATTSLSTTLKVEAMATARNRAKRKIYKSPSSKAQPHAEDPKVRGLKNALPTARVLQFNAPHTAQGSRSPPAPSLMAAHATFASPDSKGGNKMTIMPTPKLIQAIQNLGPTSKPLQVKVINRNSERDEDTSSYESDSSGDTVSMGSPLRCNTKSKGRSGAPAISTADISNPPQEATNASQILKHQTAMASEFPGVPIWFPVKIKRILVDEGCPNALPFKVSYVARSTNHLLTRNSPYTSSLDTEHGLKLADVTNGGDISRLESLGGNWALLSGNCDKTLEIQLLHSTSTVSANRLCGRKRQLRP